MSRKVGKKGGTNIALRALMTASLLLAPLVLLHAQETASSPRFHLVGGFSAASGQSASDSFRLSACLCEGIGGFSESESFRVLAGCAAFIPAGINQRPGPDPYPRPIADPDSTAPSSGPGAAGAVSERSPAEKK